MPAEHELRIVAHMRAEGFAPNGFGACRVGDVGAFPVVRLSDAAAELSRLRAEVDARDAEIAGLEASTGNLSRLVDELRPDAERLEWILRRCSGSWLRAYLGVANDTGDIDELRVLIDANRGAAARSAAQGGSDV